MTDHDRFTELRKENERLIALLETHGIEWRLPPGQGSEPIQKNAAKPSSLTTDEKVALFRRLFQGRTDIYPVRWESKTTGKSGYKPGLRQRVAYGYLRQATHQMLGM